MAAPAEVLSHGTAQSVLGISDEPASTPTVKVEKLSRKASRDEVQVKNTNGVVVRVKRPNPILTFSFEGQIALASGLAAQCPGSAVTSLANLAADYRTFDEAAGTLILGDTEDSLENLNDAPATKFDVVHFPYVVTA